MFYVANVVQRTLYDIRDNNSYTVRKLADGNCWMTDDLNIGDSITLGTDNSNVATDYKLPESNTSGFNNASVASVYNSAEYGGYYNYAAATAGTNPGSGNATSDICPKNWRLPTNSEYGIIIGKFSTTGELIVAPFSANLTGFYSNSQFVQSGKRTLYWSSTAQTTGRAYLAYIYHDTGTKGTNNNESSAGMKIRCLAK